MRKLVLKVSVLGGMMLALAVNAAAPANFAGKWTLDKAKSQGLGRGMQAADSVSWVITQDAKQITIDQKVTGGDAAGGGGGGRPQMGGPGSYNFAGRENNV